MPALKTKEEPLPQTDTLPKEWRDYLIRTHEQLREMRKIIEALP